MTAAPVHVAAERLLLDPSGALFWPREGVLALADLSLERGPRRIGESALGRLAALLRRWQPRHVLVLGVAPSGPGRPPLAASSRLATMAASHSFVWIRDEAESPALPDGIGGTAAAFWHSPPLVFRSRPMEAPMEAAAGEIAGHLRPHSVPDGRPTSAALPCFVADGARVLLPAFGWAAGGQDVRQPAIQALFPHGARVFLLGARRFSSFPIAGRRARRRI